MINRLAGRRFALKVVFSLAAAVVLIGQFSQAVTRKVSDGDAATVLPARIRAARLFSITAGVSGTITSVSVEAGDKVEAGQELGAIESAEVLSALEKARKRLELTEERAGSGRDADSRARIYSEQYAASKDAAKVACDRANQNDTITQERVYEQYSARLRAVEKLEQQSMASPAEIERSRREERDALQMLKSAREHQSRLRQECDSALAQVRVTKLQLELNRSAESGSMLAERDEAAASMKSLEEQAERQRVLARSAGTVLSALVVPGDRVAAGAPLFQMGDISSLAVEVPVDAAIAQSVKKGDPVTVRLPTHPPKQIEATVSSVVLAPGEDTRSYVVRIVIPNPDPRTVLAGLEGAVAFRHAGWGGLWAKLPF